MVILIYLIMKSNNKVEKLLIGVIVNWVKCMIDVILYLEILVLNFFVYFCIDLRIYWLIDEFI